MKKHLFWILEAFCWLLILALVAGGIIFFKYETNKKHTLYRIFLPDIDGLIIGSPVKYMGIQIGYIKEIKVIQDQVLLKFLVTEDNIKLPQNTVANVEFYGLGGSKSLELYPPNPNTGKTNDIIIAQPPKKIGDAMSLIYSMFDDISEITFTASHFMAKMGVIKKNVDFHAGNDLIYRANILFKKDFKNKEELPQEEISKEKLWKRPQ